MIQTVKNYIRQHVFPQPIKEKAVEEAYDIWSENYDKQPGNLMLDLDEILFSKLFSHTVLTNKKVADIGCGTGRHWDKILKKNPSQLTGFDVSSGMLHRLKEKFPYSETHLIVDDFFADVASESFDLIVSTLTVAHIKDIKTALGAWSRILKNGGEIILTDFHPDTLAKGGQRTFKHRNTYIAVQNFVHSTQVVKDIFTRNGFEMLADEEMIIDESMKRYYTDQNALHVYEKYKGFPIIYGLHLRKTDGAK